MNKVNVSTKNKIFETNDIKSIGNWIIQVFNSPAVNNNIFWCYKTYHFTQVALSLSQRPLKALITHPWLDNSGRKEKANETKLLNMAAGLEKASRGKDRSSV